MLKKPVISICIPTYNRCDKVIELVKDILKYEGDEIEVVVLDNLSTDSTKFLFDKIVDNRLSYVRNEKNIGGIRNIFKSLVIGNGEYCFLCLDKDRIDYQRIGDLISRLKTSNVLFGHCILNSLQEKADVVFEKGFHSVYNMSYLSAHPSGMFYKTEVLKKLPVIKQILNENKKFGFYTELVNAQMSILGESKIINLPVFYTETKEDCGKIKSFTYTNENEIFFFPVKRTEEFFIYIENLYSLDLKIEKKNKVLKKIFFKSLLACTLDFKRILNDSAICDHYFVSTRKVSFLELIKNDILFCKAFVKSKLPVNIFLKLSICIISNMKILYLIFHSKLK